MMVLPLVGDLQVSLPAWLWVASFNSHLRSLSAKWGWNGETGVNWGLCLPADKPLRDSWVTGTRLEYKVLEAPGNVHRPLPEDTGPQHFCAWVCVRGRGPLGAAAAEGEGDVLGWG